MSFEKLIVKVQQAEDALEARERTVAANLRQLKLSWRSAWTPGRIVIAGLVSGFLLGRAQPLKHAASRGPGGVLQVITAVSGFLASLSAQSAANEAGHAAEAAEDSAVATAADAPQRVATAPEVARTAPAARAIPAEQATFLRDGPRAAEPAASGPTAAEAATDLSER